MKLKDLKSAWNQYSSTNANRYQLNEAELEYLLKKRTLNLIGRIDYNFMIGCMVFLVLSLFFILDDFVFTPYLSDGEEIPAWIVLIEGVSRLFILGTFFYFGLNYYTVRKGYSQSNDLRHVLKSIIRILNTYRRLFSWALGVLLVVTCVEFITGLFIGIEIAAYRQQVAIEDLNQSQLIRQMAVGMVILTIIIGALYFFFHWGFRKLYGRYITQLEETLNELDELE